MGSAITVTFKTHFTKIYTVNVKAVLLISSHWLVQGGESEDKLVIFFLKLKDSVLRQTKAPATI